MTDDIIARMREAYASTDQSEWVIHMPTPPDADQQDLWVSTAAGDELVTIEHACYGVTQGDEDLAHFVALAHNHMPAILAVLEAASMLCDSYFESRISEDDQDNCQTSFEKAVRALKEAR